MTTDDQRIGYLSNEDGAGAPTDADAQAELDALKALLADPSTWDEPPAGLGNRVVGAIEAERRTSPSPAIAAPATERPAERPVRDRGRARGRGRGALTFVAGAAAAAVVAAGLLVVARRPTGVKVALAGTELAPGATGAARVSKHESGLRIELNATGLPRRDGKLFYQAWLKGPTGLVPIGTFHTGEHVVLWAGVALEEYPTITVTQEECCDQESSGKRVLVGTVKQ